jgi:hypothetical protein
MLKKKGKILISLLVMLVITSNISYAVTLSLCGMTMKSSCSCDMPVKSSANDETVKREPCCKQQVKDISNSSNFLTQNKTEYKPLTSSVITYEFCQYKNVCSINNIPFKLIFYESQTDLPVKYSSLLI